MDEKLPLKDVMSVLKRWRKDEVKHNWHGKSLTIKYLLPMQEAIAMPSEIMKLCSNDDGQIIGGAVEFYTRFKIVSSYTNIEFPKDVDDIYALLYDTDILDVVKENANGAQIKSIIMLVGLDPDLMTCGTLIWSK